MDHNSDPYSYTLDPACQDGDYYFAADLENYYIVYGAHVHRTSNMDHNSDPYDYSLHPTFVNFMPFTDCSGEWVNLISGPYDATTTVKFGVSKTLSESFSSTSSTSV